MFRHPVLTKTSKSKVSDSSVSTKDSTKTAPVTMKMDPKGFYLYWINQSKVIDTLESGTVTAWMQVEFLFASLKQPDCSYTWWRQSCLGDSHVMGTCQSCWIAASCAASSGVSSLWRLSIGAGVGSSCCTVLLNFTAERRRHFVFVVCDCCFIKVHFSSGHSECAPLKFPRWCFESLWCFSFSFLQTNKQTEFAHFATSPTDDLYPNPYLDKRLHVKFSVGSNSSVLVSRRQRSWMLLLSEIPEQENMPNFQKWVYHRDSLSSSLSSLPATSAGMQISCQAH